MANDTLIRALKAKGKSLNLNSRNISELSKDFVKLTDVMGLSLRHNRLRAVPVGLQCMELTELNLGNNAFEEMPPVLKHLHSLKKLFLFSNQISILHPEVLDGLSNLIVLNLNQNQIRILPTAIKSLSNLERFSIADNQLEEIPAELGLLGKLTELNLARNKLSEIPHELYKLQHLRNLSLARNRLRELPEGVHGWKNLKVLDVAGNHLSMFPVNFHCLQLDELYFEGNILVRFEPFITSIKQEEVLSLKEALFRALSILHYCDRATWRLWRGGPSPNEHAARFILKERLNKPAMASQASLLHPDIQTMLARFGRCAVCFEPFLTTWVECVQFINLRKDMGLKSSRNIPVRALLCSYSCFNRSGRSYYSVAQAKPYKVPSHTS